MCHGSTFPVSSSLGFLLEFTTVYIMYMHIMYMYIMYMYIMYYYVHVLRTTRHYLVRPGYLIKADLLASPATITVSVLERTFKKTSSSIQSCVTMVSNLLFIENPICKTSDPIAMQPTSTDQVHRTQLFSLHTRTVVQSCS